MSFLTTMKRLPGSKCLGTEGAYDLVHAAILGDFDPLQMSAALGGMAMRGETRAEILGGATALIEHALPFEHEHPTAIDTCGTGGDNLGSFNISTASALLANAAGATVIKHGNRASSSKCGSADLLEALGVSIDLHPLRAREVLNEIGITFLYAPRYHPGLTSVGPLRRKLGIRTLFNLLGPLCNPGRPKRQLLGVSQVDRVADFARILEHLGCERGLVVHGAGSADELTTAGKNFAVPCGEMPAILVDPQELGLRLSPVTSLRAGSPAHNAVLMHALLEGVEGPIADAVHLNTGACLVVAGRAGSTEEGIALSREVIASGSAKRKLQAWIDESNRPTRPQPPTQRPRAEDKEPPSRLQPILRDVRRRASERRELESLERLRRVIPQEARQPNPFLAAIEEPGLSVIAECKHRSPSRGSFGSLLTLPERAEAYARGGARAISVLTEEDHFRGCPEDLRAVVGSGLPRLRKDFLLDEAMVLESVTMGADAVLLMACCLPGDKLRLLREVARSAGLAVLLEIHDEAELERALAVDPDCLGINARDLHTFEVHLPKALKLIQRVATMEHRPLLVAESGILGPEQLQQAAEAGADAVLIGESLMREEAPDRVLAKWLEVVRVR